MIVRSAGRPCEREEEVGFILMKNLPWTLGLLIATGALATELPTPAVFPSRIYGLAGTPLEIRFANLVYAPVEGSLLFDVETGPGKQGNVSLLWIPEAGSKPQPVSIGIFSGRSFQKMDELRGELWSTALRDGKFSGTLQWLAIGDSLTAGGKYLNSTISILKERLPDVELRTIGTQPTNAAPGVPRHEGRGGWTWQRFFDSDASGTYHSPFVVGSPEAGVFDFQAYLRQQKAEPDFITIFLGVNDVFQIAASFSPEKITAIGEKAKSMVAKIREAAPGCPIGLILPPPPSEQNGFGANYGTGVTEWQYRRARQFYLAEILGEFDGRWAEGIHIIPAHLGFDPETSYPRSQGIAQNALHPNAQGYEAVGTCLAAWIGHLLDQKVIHPRP